MLTLLVMRHAQAVPAVGGMEDRDRPLADRGQAEAGRAGLWLKTGGLVPDRIVCSTALRTRQTAAAVAAAAGFVGPTDLHDRLYAAAVPAILATLAALPSGTQRALLVGHNPGLEELVGGLAGTKGHFRTAAIVVIDLPIPEWSELAETTRGRLVQIRKPDEEPKDET